MRIPNPSPRRASGATEWRQTPAAPKQKGARDRLSAAFRMNSRNDRSARQGRIETVPGKIPIAYMPHCRKLCGRPRLKSRKKTLFRQLPTKQLDATWKKMNNGL